MGSFFITKIELIRRCQIKVNKIPFDSKEIHNKLDEKLSLDQDCLGIDPVRGEILKRGAMFIDIGIPSSLLKAQKLILLML